MKNMKDVEKGQQVNGVSGIHDNLCRAEQKQDKMGGIMMMIHVRSSVHFSDAIPGILERV